MKRRSSAAWVLGLTSVSSLMVTLDATVVATALSAIRQHLGATLGELEWTTNAYALSFAVLLMSGSAAGDRFGRRKVFVIGLGLFSIASAACAMTHDVSWLIAMRAVQGGGAALVMPNALALLSEAYPPARRGWALGVLAGVAGLGVVGGPVVGGAITQGAAWQWIFWINVPIGLIAVALSCARMAESRGQNTALDLPGLLLVSGAGLGIVWGLVRGNTVGWGSPEVLLTLVGGVVLAAGFVSWELRTVTPMLPMRLWRSRAFSAGNAAAFALQASLFGAVFFMAQFQQVALAQGPLHSGLRLLPWTGTVTLVAPRAGALVDRMGERPMVVVGLMLQAIGFAWISLIAAPDDGIRQHGRPDGDRRGGHVDGLPRGAEGRDRRSGRRRARQGLGDVQHGAPARCRVRRRDRGRGLLRDRRLRLTTVLHGRVHARDARRGGSVTRRLARRLATARHGGPDPRDQRGRCLDGGLAAIPLQPAPEGSGLQRPVCGARTPSRPRARAGTALRGCRGAPCRPEGTPTRQRPRAKCYRISHNGPACRAQAAVRRPNRRDATAPERASRQMHQAIAMTASCAVLAPVDVCPIHSPRIVSMIGVNG